MQLDEFIQATGRLETYYDKELKTDQMQIMYEELKNTYPDLQAGLMHYHIDSLHIYERSEHLLKKYIEEK